MTDTQILEKCNTMLESITQESIFIIRDIDSFFQENKSKKNVKILLHDSFDKKIKKFQKKYRNTYFIVSGLPTVLGENLKLESSNKIDYEVRYLGDYIDSIPTH